MDRHAAAYRAGRTAAEYELAAGRSGLERASVNALWASWLSARKAAVQSWAVYRREAHHFLRGVFRSGKNVPDWVLLPTDKTVAVVVTAMNEARTLSLLMEQLQRMALRETVVIVNGSTDDSFGVAHRRGATVVYYPEPLGHDVGRAVGARLVQSDIVLFLDGDIPIDAWKLLPFIYAVHRGSDVALNDIMPYIGQIGQWDQVTLLKQFLNRSLGRQDLGANSLTAVPHAFSRKGLDAVGESNLIVPPKAQLLAIRRQLRISAPASVNVISTNKLRKTNTGAHNPVSELIIGDHIEALHTAMQQGNSRVGHDDHIRRRAAAGPSPPRSH